jgi:periplasmic protein CpxP/Spy
MTTTIRRFGLGLSAAVLALGMTAAVYAFTQNTAGGQAPFMGRGPMAGIFPPLQRIATRLGLSDAQKDQIKGIVQSHRDEWTSLAGRAATARKALGDAIAADPVDDNAVRQASAGVAAVQADIAVARAHARAEIFQVLTPEQQAQAKQWLSEAREGLGRMGERFHQRRGGH